MPKESIERQLGRHRERNHELKAKFERRQVDLTVARPVEFHFWAWSQRDAAVLGRALFQMGFLIRLLAPAPGPDDPDKWSIEAGAKIPLAQALGDELAEKLINLASAEDAVFDGWGTNM